MKRTRKEIDRKLGQWREYHVWADEMDNLKRLRHPHFMLLNLAEDGDFTSASDVELSQSEYAAIRRYLIRSRQRRLRAEGFDL